MIPALLGRTLTGAWIETTSDPECVKAISVAPSRVRGLKLDEIERSMSSLRSHPHGCVD